MILSYLEEAMSPDYDPRDTDLDEQRIAALRLYLWTTLAVGETAVKESERAREPVRTRLDRFVTVLLPEWHVPVHDEARLEARTKELSSLHRGIEDCRIVAEAELIGVPTLLTFDKDLQRRLRAAARVSILTPVEQWERLAIPRGTPPLRRPDATNPLSGRNFWHWD